MIDLRTGEQTYVSRLRVRCSGLDPLVAQLRLNTLFRAAEVQPAGLAPSAIVCIRRLDDPRPRTVSLSAGSSMLPPEWQQSVRASIEQLTRRAPRPARETVAADVPCVVFTDRAELLAALACDWCEQRVAARWWWRSLFTETIDAGAIVKLWRATPEYVPGALEHLARRQRAVVFARTLTPEAARAILDSLMRSFALNELQAAVSSLLQDGRSAQVVAHVNAPQSETLGYETTGEHSRLSPQDFDAGEAPWRSFAEEALSDELELSQQCLLGVGLALQRAPVFARGGSFALRVHAWLGASSSGRRRNAGAPPALNAKETFSSSAHRIAHASKPGTPPTPAPSLESKDVRASSPAHVFVKPQNAASEIHDTRSVTQEFRGADASTSSTTISQHDDEPAGQDETTRAASADPGVGTQASGFAESIAPEVGAATEREAHARGIELPEVQFDEREADAPLVSTSEAEATPDTFPLLEAHIETRFGGLFHLVNLGLFLEFYGDFTAPSRPGIALPIWDFVALLGRRMVGACVETDAVWPLLARLAGRSAGQSPGDNFHTPDAWRADAGWLQKFPASNGWRWAISRGAERQTRLQVMHPAKFFVLDVPLDREEEAEAQLERELKVYAHAFVAKLVRSARPFKLRGRTPLARWIERVHLYTRARLRLALGTRDGRQAARLLCERHARVFVTATHVDIVMRLAELPFEVRVAGLDRDPGWIPAAGRIVAFHFE